jgi:hypothetical protein
VVALVPPREEADMEVVDRRRDRSRRAAYDLVVGGGRLAVTLLLAPLLRRFYNRYGATEEELTRLSCWQVLEMAPPRHLVLIGAGTPDEHRVPDVVDVVPDRGYVASSWQWSLEPLAGGRRARLIVRQRERVIRALFFTFLLATPPSTGDVGRCPPRRSGRGVGHTA